MTTRREQGNSGEAGLPTDIDAILSSQIKAEKTRKEYQQRPDVLEKRKAYQAKQTEQRKVARAAMKGDSAFLMENGYDQATAEGMIRRAQELQSA